MYGGSYGARMTMAAVTRDSTPFSAVAPLYGSYDWEEAYPFGDRLEQKFTVELHMGFKPGENPDLYSTYRGEASAGEGQARSAVLHDSRRA